MYMTYYKRLKVQAAAMCATQATSFEPKRTHISNSHNMQFDWDALPTIWVDFLSEIGGSFTRKSHESIDSNWTKIVVELPPYLHWKNWWWNLEISRLSRPSLKPQTWKWIVFLNSYVPKFWDPESFQVGNSQVLYVSNGRSTYFDMFDDINQERWVNSWFRLYEKQSWKIIHDFRNHCGALACR